MRHARWNRWSRLRFSSAIGQRPADGDRSPAHDRRVPVPDRDVARNRHPGSRCLGGERDAVTRVPCRAQSRWQLPTTGSRRRFLWRARDSRTWACADGRVGVVGRSSRRGQGEADPRPRRWRCAALIAARQRTRVLPGQVDRSYGSAGVLGCATAVRFTGAVGAACVPIAVSSTPPDSPVWSCGPALRTRAGR